MQLLESFNTKKFKRGFCTQKPGLNVRFKVFWYTKINPTHIWYDKFN